MQGGRAGGRAGGRGGLRACVHGGGRGGAVCVCVGGTLYAGALPHMVSPPLSSCLPPMSHMCPSPTPFIHWLGIVIHIHVPHPAIFTDTHVPSPPLNHMHPPPPALTHVPFPLNTDTPPCTPLTHPS